MMEEVRAFIAVELSQEVKDSLMLLQDRLRGGDDASVKWVQPSGMHLTLKFLGNVEADRLPRLREAVAKVVENARPFAVWLGGLGVFPTVKRPRVIWVGFMGEVEKLALFQRRIDESLVPLGFAPERREFVPHLTLGRVREGTRGEELEKLGRLVQSVKAGNALPFMVEGISIMRSQLRREGALYNRLEWIRLSAHYARSDR